MGQKIFINGEEGKILTSIGNRIVKQPYEFTSAFQNRMGLSNYILIPNLSLTHKQLCDMLWINESGSSNLFYMTKKGGVQNYNTSRISSSIMYVRNNGNIISNQAMGAVGVNIIGSEITSAYVKSILNNIKGADGTGYSYIIDTIISNIIIGGTVILETSSLIPSNYNTTAKFNRYVLFSRTIGDSELSYYYNNKLGSELQSTAGLEIDLHCDFAEILDFSALQNGSDMRVGVRDYSGFNRHGQIMNLPAGDNATKLAYANANLFVPFQ